MKTFRYILLLAALFAVLACRKEPNPGESSSGCGSIVLKLGANNGVSLQTKTDPTPEEIAAQLADGRRFTNVLVVLVDNAGNVVDKQYQSSLSNVTEKDVVFSSILPGSYTAYAYANIDMTVWQSSSTINSQENAITGTPDFSTYLARELKQLGMSPANPKEAPGTPGTAMLLTGKKDIVVGLTATSETIELKRPVVRFKVSIINNTDYTVKVDNMYFTHFNPDRGYLIEHTDANGLPVVPSGTTYRELPAYNTASPVSVTTGNETVVYSTYLYENAAPNDYKIFADLTLIRDSDPSNNLSLSIGGRGFGPIEKNALDQMDEGEFVDILLVNPQSSIRSGRLYSYISSDNHLAWESVGGYSGYDFLFGRVQAIYNQVTGVHAYTYSQYTYSSANGYSAWDGLDADAPRQDNQGVFDYQGARSTYFHRLTKSGGKYSIQGLAVGETTSGTSIDNLTVEKGNPSNPGKFISGTVSYLVKFKNAGGQQLTSDTHWSNNSPNKSSFLKFDTASENQDRLFILFGQYCSGGRLSRMLSDTHKEVPLKYMSRNEDLNVIINIFYADQAGNITFRVDNSTWAGAGTTTSTHTFN